MKIQTLVLMTLAVFGANFAQAQSFPLAGIYKASDSTACKIRFRDPEGTGRVKIDSDAKNLAITIEIKIPVYNFASRIDSQYTLGKVVQSHLGMGQSIYISEYSNLGTRFQSQFRDTTYSESERPFVTTIELERVGGGANLSFLSNDGTGYRKLTCFLAREAL